MARESLAFAATLAEKIVMVLKGSARMLVVPGLSA
jgi:hypothetical protein